MQNTISTSEMNMLIAGLARDKRILLQDDFDLRGEEDDDEDEDMKRKRKEEEKKKKDSEEEAEAAA